MKPHTLVQRVDNALGVSDVEMIFDALARVRYHYPTDGERRIALTELFRDLTERLRDDLERTDDFRYYSLVLEPAQGEQA